jgi:hypothetical protein
VQEALRTGDQDAPRRAELLATIQRAQDVRADARRDLADGVIDREDWLDIRQRTEDQISAARRDYDRLTGSATVLGDIPPAEGSGRRGNRGMSTDAAPRSRRFCTRSSSSRCRPARPTTRAETRRTSPRDANARWRSCASASTFDWRV